MPALLRPDWVFDDYTAITPDFLCAQGIRLLLSDLDFTLAPKSVKDADDGLRAWVESLRTAGITLVILSNNRSPVRVERYCKGLGITYVGHAGKPRRRGYLRAMAEHGETAEHTAMLGDKLLTDCLGAQYAGMRMLMVEPAGGAKGPWQKVLHALQEPFKRIGARDTRSRGGKKTKNGAR